MAALSGSALVAGGLVAMESPVTAEPVNPYEVANLADSGAGSLRQVIADANADPDANTITFTSGLTGTITLTTGELAITENLTITGPGAGSLTVSGGDVSRVFNIGNGDEVPDLTVDISGLTVADGAAFAGGAIQSFDHLTVRDSVITGSAAEMGGGAINGESGTLTIERSVVSGNGTSYYGGGVMGFGDLTVADSTISGNTVTDYGGDGGGIYWNGGTVTIERSTISGNSAEEHGGGVYTTNNTVLTVVASTISGNISGSDGGGAAVFGAAAFRHSTIADNTSGIWADGATVTLDHSIVTGSRSGYDLESTYVYDYGTYEPTTTWTATRSLIGSRSYADGTAGDNLLDTRARLGPLADNGGPTLTHLPASTSPVVNAGDPDTLPPLGGLQRGETDVVGRAIDIGAVERSSTDPGPATFEVTSEEDSGDGTLRAAVAEANAWPEADTITFAPTVAGQITLTSGELRIRDDVTITGPGPRALTISGNDQSQVFYVDDTFSNDDGSSATSDVVITGLTLSDGRATIAEQESGGGAIYTTENLTLRDATVRTSDVDGVGGGIAAHGALTVERSTISENTAADVAGGIFAANGPVTITSSTISGNTAGRGGGMLASDATTSLRHVTITGNTATLDGGGLHLARGDVSVSHSIVSGNTDDDVYNHNLVPATLSESWSIIGADGALDLGPLADNGGATDTHLPATGSSAVDAGDPAFAPPPSTDQRGQARVQHDRIDIGAVETAAPPTTTTTTSPPTDEPPAATTTTTIQRESTTVTIPPPADDGAPAEVTVETDAGPVELAITGADDGAEVTVTTHRADQLDGSTRGIAVLDTVFEVEISGGDTGSVRACFPYTDAALSAAGIDESSLQLFHYRDDGTREVVESTIDTANNQICGTVDSLSPFALGSLRTTRLAGEDECGTAAEVSAASFEPGADVVYVTAESAYPDALAAGPAAAAAGAPFVLVHHGEVPDVSMDELNRLAPRRIIVVGGPAAVSDTVVATLAAIAPVERVAGADRYATAAALSSRTFTPGVPVAYVVRADGVADGLVAGAAAAAAGGPVLLAGATVPDVTLTELIRLAPQRIVIIGGTAGVSTAAEAGLARLAPTTRIAGADRYATAAEVLATFPTGAPVVVASGQPTGDGLTAVSAAAEQDAAVVVVPADDLPGVVADRLDALDPRQISVVGGRDVVSLQVEGDLAEYLSDDDS